MISLIVGLGNPGEEYLRTRHNAGAWFIDLLAKHYGVTLKSEKKFKSQYAYFMYNDQRIYILIPATFMNHSGESVAALANFYQIPPENILIAHDELDIPAGDIRIKYKGGHGGHNGLKSIISHLHSHDFYRLRVGIDHPRERHLVTDYVLSPPSSADKKLIQASLLRALDILPYLLDGHAEKAMQLLHTKN